MNCEQVEELLSAYLDNALAIEERRRVAIHLHECTHCTELLADYIHFDVLLSQMPRVFPSPELRNRIFSSPEYLALTGTFDRRSETVKSRTTPYRSAHKDTSGRPQLIAIPGGRATSSNAANTTETPAAPTIQSKALPRRKKRTSWSLRIMQVAIVASLLLTLAVGSLIAHNLWIKQATVSNNAGNNVPAALQTGGPLSAGTRFVFLRDGTLWSTIGDGTTPPERLTPSNIVAATDWAVSPPSTGHTSGDLIAYIDLQKAQIHIIHSDRQRDTIIPQPLLKEGVSPTSVWDTETGATILNGLAWSKDSSMLAFVADPTGTGMTNLYIYSVQTSTVELVPLTVKGKVANPIWSPDGIRVAFALIHNGSISIQDFNSQNHGLLTIADGINTQGNTNDVLLNLDWSPSIETPAITWSIGTPGHVQSIWVRRVGVDGTVQARLLATGDYSQASYSRIGHGGIGSWLLVANQAGHPADLWRVDLSSGAVPVSLTSGKQIGFAEWAPDGMAIDYLDALASGIGKLYIANLTTGANSLIATSVAAVPAPAWSIDNQSLVYSTGMQSFVVKFRPDQQTFSLKLQGEATTFIWSPSSPDQLVISLSSGQTGIYLVDTQHNTAVQLDKQDTTGPIQWSQIP